MRLVFMIKCWSCMLGQVISSASRNFSLRQMVQISRGNTEKMLLWQVATSQLRVFIERTGRPVPSRTCRWRESIENSEGPHHQWLHKVPRRQKEKNEGRRGRQARMPIPVVRMISWWVPSYFIFEPLLVSEAGQSILEFEQRSRNLHDFWLVFSEDEQGLCMVLRNCVAFLQSTLLRWLELTVHVSPNSIANHRT